MQIRTVLDLRHNKKKYVIHALLLGASWHQRIRPFAPLEFFTIGSLPDFLSRFFNELGIQTKDIQPSQNDSFSDTANAIEGSSSVPGKKILLIDNDIYFLNSISPLAELPENSFYGCPSGGMRVSPEHWSIIENELNISPFQAPFIPLKVQLQAIREPETLQQQTFAYVNGGVLLIPPDYNLLENWQLHQKKIYDLFKDHPLSKGAVTSSNMAALATCIGDYGNFSWLPHAYNYRHACFPLGLCETKDIKIIHMTGDPAAKKELHLINKGGQSLTIKQRMVLWWESKVDSHFEGLEKYIGRQERDRRWDISRQALDSILSTIDQYNLESLVKADTLEHE